MPISLIFKLAPMALSYGAKLLKMRNASAGIEANPRATNGGVTTALVTITIALLGANGITTTGLEPVIASVFGTVGVAYTYWRAKR